MLATALTFGCGIAPEDTQHAYLLGFHNTLNSWPCSVFNCEQGNSQAWTFYVQQNPDDEDGARYVEEEAEEQLKEAAIEGCSPPTAAEQLTLNRVEAAELGAFEACKFGNSIGYSTNCRKAPQWMQDKALEDFGSFVNALDESHNNCAAAVRDWDL